ncbi:helix-turn-helix transcriptional regulator [Arenimonas sp.]|uniref:helix-turn-helix transcriptional regulator n=1 Tax=Arenimonas sp. TaxID=1872635 RepID=UPI0039E65391
MWKRAVHYGAWLAGGAIALQWLDYRRLAHVYPGEIYVLLIAAGFLALGIVLGVRIFRPPPAVPFDGNPKARAALGMSERELTVLQEMAAGYSNKEIARRLDVSPNTVKTHVARVFEKLGENRRTAAVRRARELGLVP